MRTTMVEEFRSSVSDTREIVGELSKARRDYARSMRASRTAISESRELLRRIEAAVARPSGKIQDAARLPLSFFLFGGIEDARAYSEALRNTRA